MLRSKSELWRIAGTLLSYYEARKHLFRCSRDNSSGSGVLWASAPVSRLPFQSVFVEQP
jgi:hypothetical protein